MATKKYPKSLIFIHWFTVLLLAVQIILGMTVEDKEFGPKDFNWFRAHALLGMFILLLTIIRIYLKNKHRDEIPAIDYYSSFHKLLVNGVHGLMYLLLIVMPIQGFIMVYKTGALQYDLGGPFPEGAKLDKNLTEVHETFYYILLVLILMHVAGIILYKIKTGENLLKRMCLLSK